MPDPAMAINITGNDADAARMIARQQRDIDKLKASLRELGHVGKESHGELSNAVSGVVVQYLSLQGVLNLTNRSMETYIGNLKEAAEAGKGMADQTAAFAAMQVGQGNIRSRILQVSKMAETAGITDRQAAFGIAAEVQAGHGGDFLKTAKELPGLFQLTRLGMSPADVKALASTAAARGRDPELFSREVFLAGEKAHIAPENIVQATRAVEMFASDEEGLAVVSAMMPHLGRRGAMAVRELPELLEGGGAGKKFAHLLKRAGMKKDASVLQELAFLQGRGLTSAAALEAAGVEDPAKAQLIAAAVQEYPRIAALTKELPTQATAEVFDAKERAILAAMPEAKIALKNRVTRAEVKNLQAIGPQAVEGLLEESEGLRMAKVLRKRGEEQLGPFDLIDKEGEVPRFWRKVVGGMGWLSDLGAGGSGKHMPTRFGGVEAEMSREDQHSERLIDALHKNTEVTSDNTQRTSRGGPALVPAGEDR